MLVVALSISPLSFKLRLHTIGVYHNIGHYLVYLLTGVLLWLIAERWYWRLLHFVLGMAVALGQEWAENRLYHAGFEWTDVRMDLAGLVTAYALMVLIVSLREAERGY